MNARYLALSIVAVLSFVLASCCVSVFGGESWIDGRQHQNEELSCDLPERDHIKNIGSYRDGFGMCVMSSIEMAARYQGMEEYRGLRNWCAKEGGGAYPEKVDRQLAAYAKEKGLPTPNYIQYEGGNPADILRLCDKTGRMACITYGYSPRYGGTIAHMTCCPKFGGKFAVCLDNNYPGEQSYEWMSLDEMVRRVNHPNGQGWVFVWLSPPPPPAPKN